MNNFLNIYKIFIFKDFYLFVIWFFILSGINVNIDYLVIDNNKNIFNWFYSFRAYIQFIILAFLIYKNFKYFDNIKKINYFFILFFIYNIIQIFSLFLSENNNLNIIYNVCAINVLLFLNIFFTKENDEIKKIFYFFTLLITVIFLYFYFEKIYYLIIRDRLIYGHWQKEALLLPLQNIPRSSGLGRMAIIIFLFFIIFFNSESIKNKFILAILIIPGIFLTQSRTIIGIYSIMFFIISFSKYFNFNNLQIRNLKQNLIFLIVFPLLISLLLTQTKRSNRSQIEIYVNQNIISNEQSLFHTKGWDIESIREAGSITTTLIGSLNDYEKDLLQSARKTFFVPKYKIIRDTEKNSFSSYRFRDWKNLINITIASSVIIGNGTQADRFLINQTASNGLIYFFSSSGIFGIIIYFMILFYIIKIVFSRIKYIQKKNLRDKNYIFSIFIIIVFLLRSLFESSYAVFSIDYIYFIISLFIINYEKKSKN